MAQTRILRLGTGLVMDSVAACIRRLPHPSSNGEPLEGKVLRVFKDEVTDVKYRSEPERTKRQPRTSDYQGVDRQYQLYLGNVQQCQSALVRIESFVWTQALTDWSINLRLGCHLSEDLHVPTSQKISLYAKNRSTSECGFIHKLDPVFQEGMSKTDGH